MATIVVTGASGFVGRHLTRALEQRGDTVVAISLRDPTTDLARAVDGADAVVHLAGETVVGRWTDAKRARIAQSRHDGTRRVVDAIAAAANRPAVLVSASAIGFYGSRGDETLTEQSAAGDGFLADVCRTWEATAAQATEFGVRVVPLRFGVILGRDGGAYPRLRRPTLLGVGGRLGSGRQWWSWIHIDDVVGLILFALDRDDLRGPVNGTAPAPAKQIDVQRAISRSLRRPAIAPVPAWVLRLLLGGFSEELLRSVRALPAAAAAAGYTFRHPTIGEAAEALARP